MFSIPVAGLAKALLVVTIPLHPAAAHQAPAHYTVKPGDTLSSIARHEYGSTADWPALWWVNRDKVSNPQVISVGQKLKLSAWHPRKGWINRAAMAAIPAPAPAPVEAAPAAAPAPASAPVSTAPAASYSGASGSYQACVIQAESGGNASAVNSSSGAGGLYGFLPSTWQALGHSGLPENASVAEQNQAFQQEYAQGGTGAWSPYDGC
jgi:resuscitation-promoting factor RpfC